MWTWTFFLVTTFVKASYSAGIYSNDATNVYLSPYGIEENRYNTKVFFPNGLDVPRSNIIFDSNKVGVESHVIPSGDNHPTRAVVFDSSPHVYEPGIPLSGSTAGKIYEVANMESSPSHINVFNGFPPQVVPGPFIHGEPVTIDAGVTVADPIIVEESALSHSLLPPMPMEPVVVTVNEPFGIDATNHDHIYVEETHVPPEGVIVGHTLGSPAVVANGVAYA